MQRRELSEFQSYVDQEVGAGHGVETRIVEHCPGAVNVRLRIAVCFVLGVEEIVDRGSES